MRLAAVIRPRPPAGTQIVHSDRYEMSVPSTRPVGSRAAALVTAPIAGMGRTSIATSFSADLKWSVRACRTANGLYKTASGAFQAFALSEVNATWGNAVRVAGPLNAGRDADVNWVSCASAGYYAAGGYYKGASAKHEEFV